MIYKLFHQHAAKRKYEQLFHATNSALANKDDSVFLEIESNDFELTKDTGDTSCVLSFKNRYNQQLKVSIKLEAPVLEALARQIENIAPVYKIASSHFNVNADWRTISLPLKRFSDDTWICLVGEMKSYEFSSILWYLNDADLAKSVLSNMPVREADKVVRLIASKYDGKRPDDFSPDDWQVQNARDDIKEMLRALQLLMDEGRIKEDFL